MLYAYCVRRAGDPPPDASVAGLEEAAVSLLEGAGMGVWLSAVEQADPTPERLREHDRVVRAALRTATPLPLRFGARLRDERAVLQMLEARREELLAGLERVTGHVEMGVVVGWNADAEREHLLDAQPELRISPDAPATGRQYLERLRGAHRLDALLREQARALLARVATALAAESLPTVQTLVPTPEVAGMLAHLVPRVAVTTYRQRFECARAALPELRLTLSGPWAPYSFV